MQRSIRSIGSWAVGMALALLTMGPMLAGCRPDPAYGAIVKPAVTVKALGDTLKLRSTWGNAGVFDSVVLTYNSASFPVIRKAWPFGRTADSSIAIPAPPLQPGSAVSIVVVFAVKVGGVLAPSGQIQTSYTQPGVIPGTVTVIGLDIRPTTVQLAVYSVLTGPPPPVQFCTFARMSDGTKQRTTNSSGPECDGWWNSYRTEVPS